VSPVDPTLPLFEVQTLAQEVDAVLVRERLIATLASLFGLLALALASVGLYGLLAFAMARRIPEFGMRVALGAASRDVLRMVMLDAAVLVGVGCVVGMAAGALAARWAGSRVSGLLYGVEIFDRTTFIVAPLVLVATALAAAYLPARRASRVDPVVALRAE
jgi:putative ABC transport system permease protein